MMRMLKAAFLALFAALWAAGLVLNAGCKGKSAAPPAKATEKPKVAPAKAPPADKTKEQKAKEAYAAAEQAAKKSPKDFDAGIKAFTDAKAAVAGTKYEAKCAERIAALQKDKAEADKEAKAQKAKLAYEGAEQAYKKSPKDFDAAIKAFTDAKAVAAGSKYEAKCVERIAELQKDKVAAEKGSKGDKAKTAYEAALASYQNYPTDFDGAVSNFEAVKTVAAGTEYEKKSVEMIARIQKDKAAAAAAPKPVTARVAQPAEGVKTAEEAWKRAGELEKAKDQPERERLSAALPYYLFVVKTKDAEGNYDANAPAAALRIAEIVEKYAADDAERLAAAKFYLAAANLNLGSEVWEKAEKPYIKAGKGAELAELLRRISLNAAARAGQLSAAGDAESRSQADSLSKFSASVGKRADALAAKYK